MDTAELHALIADLRAEGSDVADVEVKRSSGEFPRTVAETLSAFANTPGGGLLLFGLDEANGFEATGVYDPASCKAALASVARQSVDPPVIFSAQTIDFEGVQLVVAEIQELPSVQKPCHVKSSGKAYLRAHDGDYALSQLEIQAFIANRSTPRFDQEIPEGTSREDLDPELVSSYIRSCQNGSASLRRLEPERVLFHTGVLASPGGPPTVAGLLALGTYPQRFLPNAVIQASIPRLPGDPLSIRFRDSQQFDGPIPVMLEEAMSWVALKTSNRIRFGSDGHGHNEPEYPVDVVRELVANALVHRDLGPYALSQSITLKIEPGQLIISNPGGLWGVTADRLGTIGVTSARNGYLTRICRNVGIPGDRRVIEALASGIPTVLRALHEANMTPPSFHDQGIRFTVRVPNHVLLSEDDLTWLGTLPDNRTMTDVQRHALVAMRHGTRWTNKSLRAAFPMDSRVATATLTGLVKLGYAQPVGDGSARAYEYRAPSAPAPRIPEAASAARTGAPHYANRETNAQTVYECLVAHGPSTVDTLCTATGLTPHQVRYVLTLLRGEGRVRAKKEYRKPTVYSPAPDA